MKVLMPTSDMYNLGFIGYSMGYKLLITRPDILAKKVPANRCSTSVSPPPAWGMSTSFVTPCMSTSAASGFGGGGGGRVQTPDDLMAVCNAYHTDGPRHILHDGE